VCPVHGAFSQNHLEATARGLVDKGINTEIVRNGNRCYFEEDGIRFEKTKEKGSIDVIDGAISYMNCKNPYGSDVNDAQKRNTVDDYLAWDQKRMFGGKSYVLQEADGSLSTVFDCGGVYKEGEKVDRMNLKFKPKDNQKQANAEANNGNADKKNKERHGIERNQQKHDNGNHHSKKKGKYPNNYGHGGKGGYGR